MATNQPNMERFLRKWRQDALNKGQYAAAIFVGDKILAWTDNDEDAFWLAQVHFTAGNYTRAQTLLAKQDLISRNTSCRYLSAHCLIKQNKYGEALALLGERSPTHLFVTKGSSAKRKTGRAHGTSNGHLAHGLRSDQQRHQQPPHKPSQHQTADESEEEASDRRYEAAMCYLRGLCYARQNAFDRAKEAYKDALRIDVQCFEAFSQLVQNSLMSPAEEHEFMELFDFGSITAPGPAPASGDQAIQTIFKDRPQDENTDTRKTARAPGAFGNVAGRGAIPEGEPGLYVHMLYQTQLSKYDNQAALNTAIDTLSTHYGLANNADMLRARAELFFTQCRFRDALAITEAVIRDDEFNFAAYPLHLACLYELGETNALFLVSHRLADTQVDEPCTWLAVGTYYFATGKIAEARRFFSKASMMDASFGPAWIGFAHTFAAEGEHDQAVTAYSTAARLFTGTHLPQVFLGMQNHAMNNMTAAEEFLKTAYSLCSTDPLLLNEMGIVLYHQDRLREAASMFKRALRVAEDTGCEPYAWLGARTNLAHAYRRLRQFDRALVEFDQVLRDGGKDAAVFSGKGLILLEKGDVDDAVRTLHEALAIYPQDAIATELLNKALEESAAMGLAGLGFGGGRKRPGGQGGKAGLSGEGGWGAEGGADTRAAGEPLDNVDVDRVLEQRTRTARAKMQAKGFSTRGPASALGGAGVEERGRGKGKGRAGTRPAAPRVMGHRGARHDSVAERAGAGESSVMDMGEDE